MVIPPTHTPCARCGAALVPLERDDATRGGIFFGACKACGNEQGIGIADRVVPADWPHPEYVEVVVHWDSDPADAAVLKALRTLVPGLARVPVSRLRARLSGRSNLSLGAPDPESAEELRERASAAGLRVEVREPVSTWDEGHCCLPANDLVDWDEAVDASRESHHTTLCPRCGLRPGHSIQVPNRPFSDFACDECAANTVTVSPAAVLLGGIGLGVVGVALWVILRS